MKTKNSDWNKKLSELPSHATKKCCRCGIVNTDGVLNIEGGIHHRTTPACLDKKACRRRQRRVK